MLLRGKAHNRELAAFQLKEAVNLMEKGAILRPKYAEDMDEFVAGIVATMQAKHRDRGLGQLRGARSPR